MDGDRLEEDLLVRTVVGVGVDAADLADDVHPVGDLAEDGVAVVEVGLGVERDEELRAVRVRPGVRHAQDPFVVVAQLVVELVVELVAGPAPAGAGRVAGLDHEVLDDSVEEHVVVQGLALDLLARLGVGPGLLARREADEVFDGSGRALVVQFDVDVALARVQGRSKVSHIPGDDSTGENGSGLRSVRARVALEARPTAVAAVDSTPQVQTAGSRTATMSNGTHTAREVTLARLPSGVELTTTIHTYRGAAADATDSPTLYVQAAQHGREINGTEVLRRFHDRLPLESLTGTIVAVPVANPITFDHVTYTAPEQYDSVNPNMNRVWPGDDDGSLHQRMAARLWEEIERADALVDLHTGSPNMLPHVVFREGDDRSRRLAEAFGTDLLLSEEADEDAPEEWHQRNFAGKLRVAASEAGIPSITPELAHNKQIVEDAVETGVEGLLDALRYLGMLPGDAPDRDQRLARNHLGQVTAEASGLFRSNPSLELGQSITEGTPIGTVYEPTTYEPLHEAVADRDGILYTLTQEATVVAGDQLASVALVRSE